jgi:hypothetical protein
LLPLSPAARASGLTPWQRAGLALLLIAVVVFGVLVEIRSAFQNTPKGDLGVFVRTAWAVRSGQDIYSVSFGRFHYHYPPLLAILLVPLADPPAGVEASEVVPYPVTVAVWYLLSLACLALAVHWLASALEEISPDPAVRAQPRGSRRWWALRLVPVLACLPPIGHTLMRGQVNLLLLLLVCGLIGALLRGRRGQAGLWLSGAICLKVIPAFLLLVPVCRRDGRCLAGCALGLVLGLGVIPAAVFGPARAWAYYEEWTQVLVRPALGAGADRSRARELIEVTATDSQSIQAALHNALYPDPATRPGQPAPWVRHTHWLAGGLLTLLTLWASRRRWGDGPAVVIGCGALVTVMLLLSPVCHLHYFCLLVPLVMGLLAASWEGKHTASLGPGLLVLLAVVVVANTLPHFLVFQRLRDDGLAGGAALVLWLAGVIVLGKRGRPGLGTAAERPAVSGAAA